MTSMNIRIAKRLVRLAKELAAGAGKSTGLFDDTITVGFENGLRTGAESIQKTMVLDLSYDPNAADYDDYDEDYDFMYADDEGDAATALEAPPAAVEKKKTIFTFGEMLDIAMEKLYKNMNKAYYRGTAPEDRSGRLIYTLAGISTGASNGMTLKKISPKGDLGEVTVSAELSNYGQLPSIKVSMRFFGSFVQGRGKNNVNVTYEPDVFVFPVALADKGIMPIKGKDGVWYVPAGYSKSDIIEKVCSYIRGWIATSKAGILSEVAQRVVNPNA